MKKKLVAGLGMVLTLAVMTGCSGNSGQSVADGSKEDGNKSGSDVTTLEFFQQKGEEGPQKGYQEIIDKFNKEYPEIKIEMNTVPDAGKVLTSRIASDDIPVLFSDYPTQMQFKQKVESGFVEKLSGQDFLQNVNESALEMSKANDGETYALPYSNNYMGVFYNKEIFEENDLEIPETYDDFIRVCETLQEAGITPIGVMGKDPTKVGHILQSAVVAWTDQGVEKIKEATEGTLKLADDSEMQGMAKKLGETMKFANKDMLGMSDTVVWEGFSNGKYAMCITGSYAKGTLTIANPDLQMGVFPLPGDSKESTKVLSGVDAAICVSAKASEEEKACAMKFLEFLARPENAQIFCDNDGAPSCIKGVKMEDEGVAPVLEAIEAGRVHDWMASTIDNNVVTDLYNVTQQLLSDGDTDHFLANMDESIAVSSQQ